MGLTSLLDDPNCDRDGKNSTGLGADAAAYRPIYEAAFQNKSAAELVQLIRGLEGAAYPYHSHETLFADEQTQRMQLLQPASNPTGTYQTIKMPWNFSGMQAVPTSGAPGLGSATGQVLAELGYDSEQRTSLFATGAISGVDTVTATTATPVPAPPAMSAPQTMPRRSGPLAGIRVMDISGMGVGPVTGRFLAELGAEVIKVEPPHGDLALTVPPTQGGTSVLPRGQPPRRGIYLNLKDRATRSRLPTGRKVDIIENFRGASTASARLRGASPPAIRASSMLALRPVAAHYLNCRLSIPYIQLFRLRQYANGPPDSRGGSRNIGFIDLSTSAMTVPAILAALMHREHTGKGQLIIASMLEAASTLQTSRIAEYLATGHCAPPHGSGMPYAVPDQAFAVRDGYLAISARTQTEWESLCRALDRQDLLDNAHYRTLADRLTHRDTLIDQLAETLRVYPSAWWIKQLSRAGVPCGGFHAYNEMSLHPQVRLNGLMTELPTSQWGNLRVAGLPWSFGLTPGVQRPGPLPGSDTAAVLTELLGEAGVQSA